MYLGGSSDYAENFVQLIKDVPDSWKTWSSIEHFHQNAAYSPNIQRRRVVGRAKRTSGGRYHRVTTSWE